MQTDPLMIIFSIAKHRNGAEICLVDTSADLLNGLHGKNGIGSVTEYVVDRLLIQIHDRNQIQIFFSVVFKECIFIFFRCINDLRGKTTRSMTVLLGDNHHFLCSS